jgi:hypothetical protein
VTTISSSTSSAARAVFSLPNSAIATAVPIKVERVLFMSGGPP